MKYMMLLCAAVAVGCMVAACGGTGDPFGRSDEQVVRTLVERQHKLLQTERWRDLYQTMSPEFRSECGYDEFSSSYKDAIDRGVDLTQIRFSDPHVAVSGDVARVTYTTTYEGDDAGGPTDSDPDVYRRVDGKWYDDVDAHTQCA